MKKRIGLAAAMVLLSLGVSAPGFDAVTRITASAVYCPELPAECCRIGWSGGCKVCVQIC